MVVNVVVVWGYSSIGGGVELGISFGFTFAKMMHSVSAVWHGISGQSRVCTINTMVVHVVVWAYSSIGGGVVLGISFGSTFANQVMSGVDTVGVWDSSGGISSWHIVNGRDGNSVPAGSLQVSSVVDCIWVNPLGFSSSNCHQSKQCNESEHD